jgi:hypothetical protein
MPARGHDNGAHHHHRPALAWRTLCAAPKQLCTKSAPAARDESETAAASKQRRQQQSRTQTRSASSSLQIKTPPRSIILPTVLFSSPAANLSGKYFCRRLVACQIVAKQETRTNQHAGSGAPSTNSINRQQKFGHEPSGNN